MNSILFYLDLIVLISFFYAYYEYLYHYHCFLLFFLVYFLQLNAFLIFSFFYFLLHHPLFFSRFYFLLSFRHFFSFREFYCDVYPLFFYYSQYNYADRIESTNKPTTTKLKFNKKIIKNNKIIEDKQ